MIRNTPFFRLLPYLLYEPQIIGHKWKSSVEILEGNRELRRNYEAKKREGERVRILFPERKTERGHLCVK